MQGKIKHLAGWVTSSNTSNPQYIEAWRNRALEAEGKANLLAVFEIPTNGLIGFDFELIQAIEALIEERLLTTK